MKQTSLFAALLAALLLLPHVASAALTNVHIVATVIQSTNTATSIVVAKETGFSRIKFFFTVRADCHYAFGREATTNDPIIKAWTPYNEEVAPVSNDSLGFRSTNTTATIADIYIRKN